MPAVVSFCRCAVRAASYLAPPELRAEWVEQWMAEIQHGYADLLARRAPNPEIRRKLLRFSRGAFADAADLRRSSFHLQSFIGQPVFCLAVPLLSLMALLVSSHGLRNCRQTIAGLPYTHPEQLMLLSRSADVLGIESSPSIADLQAWQASTRLALAGFVFEGRTLEATPNFYAVLGATPHRPFRFLGREVAVVAPLDARWRKVGIVARVVTPASPAQLAAELARVPSRNGSYVSIRFLEERMREPLLFCSGAFLLALVSGLAMLRRPWRGAAFFTAKTVLLQCAIAASWAEFVSGLAISPTGGMGLAASLLLPALLLLAAASGLAWSLHDQKLRCPVCCRILSMPVRIGSRGSVILDRPCVEVLCPRGHGSLLIPDSTPHPPEGAAWTAFHESWKDCFAQGGSK